MLNIIQSVNYPNFYSKKDKECIREIIGKKDNNCECNFQSILDTEVGKLKEVANE